VEGGTVHAGGNGAVDSGGTRTDIGRNVSYFLGC